MFGCSICAVIITFFRCHLLICKQYFNNLFLLFTCSSRKQSQPLSTALIPSSATRRLTVLRMEYGAPWRECDPRMYDFTEQSLPEPWEPRGRFHFPGHGEGRRRFSRWPDHQFSGHSSIDEYLLNSRSAYTPPCWHDRPFRDQYATHLPYRTRVDFFNIFRSRSEGHGTHPPSYPHAFTNAEQSHANPLRYSFFNNSHADDVWPRATGASEGTVYPDSIEEVRKATLAIVRIIKSDP